MSARIVLSCFPVSHRVVQFIAVSGNAVGVGSLNLDLLVSRFFIPIRNLVTKCDLRCFVALVGILPARR